MSEVSIFKNRDVAVAGKRAPSELTKSLMKVGGSGIKRISPRNGIFVRLVNGEASGKLKNPLRVVFTGVAQARAQRTFYIKAFDKNAEATPPDCQSNDGVKPDAHIKNPQGKTCDSCPQNIAGSGQGGGKACRYKRRVAVVLPDDLENNASGDVYQLEIASKSIFGKGAGNVFPLNAYIDYIIANGEDVDGVVTEISFNEDNDNQSVLFRAVDFVNNIPGLRAVVDAAIHSPESQKAVTLSTTAFDKGADSNEDFAPAPVAAKPVVHVSDEPDDEPVPEPVKRASKKPEPVSDTPKKSLADVVDAWSDDTE